jgi:hypothetical protein
MDTHLPEFARCASRMRKSIAATVSLALAGCASGSAADHVVSVTYQYSDQNRSSAVEHALLTAQDDCFLAGYEYAQPAGPPNIVSDVSRTSGPSQVTMSFHCIGLRN